MSTTSWSLAVASLEPLEQHRGHLAGWGVQIAAGGPLVSLSGGVAAGWGDHIATPAPPIHILKIPRLNVAEAGGDQVVVPATSAGPHQRPRTVQTVGGGQGAESHGQRKGWLARRSAVYL